MVARLSVPALMITGLLMLAISGIVLIGHTWTQPVLVASNDQVGYTMLFETGSDLKRVGALPLGSRDWFWSPDGTHVALSDVWGDTVTLREIYVYALEGGSIRNISNHPASDSSPAWSPDSKQIAFVSWRDKNADIYIADLDSRALINITHHPADDISPVWSPDGHRLAFVSSREGDQDIYVVNADGSQLRNLSKSPAHDTMPVWSPAGDQIMFVSLIDDQSEILVVDTRMNIVQRLAGSYRRILTLFWAQAG